MKRSRLGSLIAAGVIAAATIILAAPAASARPIDDARHCIGSGGRYNAVPHYEFDTNGNATRSLVYNCVYPDGDTVWFDD